MKKFVIKCNICGSEDVGIWDWHNDDEEGKRLKCNKCGAKEEI